MSMDKLKCKELCDILSLSKEIGNILENETYDSFIHRDSRVIQAAVAWKFLMMGECAAIILKKYPRIDVKYPNLKLKYMRGMRGYLRNPYDALDTPILWETATKELPEIEDALYDALSA